ncbi:MAG: hypothetical protein IPJ31_14600 [Bacteroidetes bacterium]|nr:hypothetical protein [Bacteroidota bacterium]MBP6315333.1 hypothetical protein [Chitinophagaceae bacterium]
MNTIKNQMKKVVGVLTILSIISLFVTPKNSDAQFNLSDVKKVKRKVENKTENTDNNRKRESEDNPQESKANNASGKERGAKEDKSNSNQVSRGGGGNDDWQFVYQHSVIYRKLYETASETRMSSRSNSNPIPVRGKEYYEAAKDFPREKLLRVLADPDKFKGGSASTAQDFKARLEDYENYISRSGILIHAKKLAGLSYEEMKKKNEVKALELAEDAKGYCNGVLALSPNNLEATEILVFAEKAYTNANASMAGATTGSLHSENKNKIVWSTKKFPNGPQTANDIKTSFKSGETIYGTAFLSAKLIDRIRPGGTKLYLTIKVDDQKIHFYDPYIAVTEEMKQHSFVHFALVPSLSDDLSLETRDGNKTLKEFNELMTQKGPMSYKISLSFEFSKTNEKIEGSFNYDLSDGSEYSEKITAKLEEAMAGEVKLPEGLMKNAALEAEMLKLVSKYATKGEKYAKPRILSSDWGINKNNLGIITDRTIMTAFVATFPDGHCELQRRIFVQDYAGGGSYSNNLKMLDDPYSPKKMKCENAR